MSSSSSTTTTTNKIGDCVLKNADFIRQLALKKPSSSSSSFLLSSKCHNFRKHLLRDANSDQLLTIVEICYNILRSRLPLSKGQRRTLIKQANIVRSLSRTRSVEGARRLLIRSENQKGRGLPAIAYVLANILLPILTNLR
jgi:hypothetical protein